MMTQPQILHDVAEGVGVVTLNRPEAMNAFGGTMREDLLEALQRMGRDQSVRCIVITGAGKAFCAGGDIPSMVDMQARNESAEIRHRLHVGAQVVDLIRTLPKPVIAAINGAAAGAGMNLALACDMRIAAESARFAEGFVKIGLVPDWGGTFLLTQLVGTAKAMELMMTGDRIGAADAARLGIVNHVVADDRFRDEVSSFARKLACGPAKALAQIKHATYAGAAGTLAQSFEIEAAAQMQIFLGDDAREGMLAFVQKREPRFS